MFQPVPYSVLLVCFLSCVLVAACQSAAPPVAQPAVSFPGGYLGRLTAILPAGSQPATRIYDALQVLIVQSRQPDSLTIHLLQRERPIADPLVAHVQARSLTIPAQRQPTDGRRLSGQVTRTADSLRIDLTEGGTRPVRYRAVAYPLQP